MNEISVGEWRWIRPDAGAEDYLERDWQVGLLIGINEGTVLAEHQDGRRGEITRDRVGEPCAAHEFIATTWRSMERRARAVRDEQEAACSQSDG